MIQAKWKGVILAQSDKTIEIEGNHYFPKESINQDYFKKTNTHTTCPWKGEASYYSIEVDGETNADAAWYYANPKSLASGIKDHVAFWRGVKVG
jgi:uncharacterized protein (DUF427 family)